MLRDEETADRIEAGWRTAGLGERREAMLTYAAKLTLTPAAMSRGDVGSLREVGFSDAAVLAIAEVTSYYAYVNRIADGLGVVLE